MTITMREYLPEGTPAADTLKNAQKARPNTTAAAKVLELFMRLSPMDQERHLDYLAKTLGATDNDAWKTGEDYAERNRKGLKDNPSNNKKSLADIRKGLKESFPGTSDELIDKMTQLFSDAVAKKTIVEAVEELLVEEPYFSLLFGDVAEIVAAEALAERITELEERIAWYEEDNNRLYEEINREPSDGELMEDFVITQQRNANKPRRSIYNLADDLGFNPDPDNIVLVEEDRPRRQNDPMSKRVAYLEQTSGGRPIVAPSGTATSLLETWEKTTQ